ncbi:MAG: type transport system permease protein [Frankiales bacterium]|nr:type transport system permease protein [Frankiales bacterium]
MTTMSPPKLLAHQVKYEQKAFWRNPPAALFTFAFPLMFLVIFAAVFSSNRIDYLGNVKYNQYFVPAITAYGVISACYTALGIQIPLRRDSGQLKRLRATPLPSWAAITGYIANSLLVALLLIVLTLGLGTLAFGLRWHGHLLALVCTVILGSTCFCALGVSVANLVPNADAAGPIVNLALFPVLFLSGTFFPINNTSVISKVADYLPVRPFTKALFAVFDPRTRGLGFDGRSMLVMGTWLVVAAVFAVRRFRWEPRRP